MAYNVPSFLKRDGDALVYNGEGEFHFYIPNVFYESKYIFTVGEYMNVLGIMDYSINNKPDGSTYFKNLKKFYYPTAFLTKPNSTEKVKDYLVLKYKKGDQVVTSVFTPQIMDNVEDLYRLFIITGKVPSTVEYGTIWKYFIDSMKLNGGKYGIAAQAFACLESEICRDPNDKTKPFRLSSKREDRFSFVPASIVDLPKNVSAYTAITSQNWDESVIAASMNKSEVHTPLEKVLVQ